ncbi:MAG TPA: hypothetical protein VN408_02400 [Actinoplanes sp.]|nr:hypothetical protein [Actinoplanes sp.]
MAGTVQALLSIGPGGALRVEHLSGEPDGSPVVDGFYELTEAVAARARDGVVGYLHAEFFGGAGFHAAVAWRDGAVVWGPMFTATRAGEAEDHYVVTADRTEMAGNVLLRWLGVARGDAIDEFAAAGLDSATPR